MKRHFLILILFVCVLSAHAQNSNKVVVRPPRPKVGLALGGGGAKGAAHIGVLKYIEEMGIPIDYVAGTSIGSIIGGLYAMGYSPDELAELIANMNWSEYVGNSIDRTVMSYEMRQRYSTMTLNIPFSLSGLWKGNRTIGILPSAYVNNTSLINLFNDLCVGYQQDMDFNNLPIPFACVATDVSTGEEIIIRNGSVPTAMRASMAIPGVFAPVKIGDRMLVDGGLVNNFPTDVLQEMGADIIIGVEVSDRNKMGSNQPLSFPDIFNNLLNNAVSAKRKENKERCSIYITPDITGYNMLSFNSEAIDTLVNRGYKKATEYKEQLATLKQHLDEEAGYPVNKQLRAPKAQNLANAPVYLRSITFNQSGRLKTDWFLRKGGLKIGQPVTERDINHAINLFRGTGAFNDITYNLTDHTIDSVDEKTCDTYSLVMNFSPTQPHVFGFGARYDTEDGAALMLNISFNEKQFGGSKLSFTGKLSYNPKLTLTYTYSQPSLANFNLSYSFRSEHFRTKDYGSNKGLNLHYLQQKASGYISQFHLLNANATLGLTYTITSFDLSGTENQRNVENIGFVLTTNRILTPFATMEYDNLDDAYFAKRGMAARLTGHYYYEPKAIENKVFDICYSFRYYITPADWKITLIPQAYGRFAFHLPDNYYYNLGTFCGGEMAGRHFEEQMPFIGINYLEQLTDMASIFRFDFRYNFYGKHYITAMYNLVNEWNTRVSSSGAGLNYAYRSRLGPISMTFNWTNFEKPAVGAYFSFGFNF